MNYIKPDCPKCRTNINVSDGTGSGGSGKDENDNFVISDNNYYQCSKCKGSFSIKMEYIKIAKKNIVKRIFDPSITGTSG